jgi:hypothetical protein
MKPIHALTDFSASHGLDEVHTRIELLVKIAMITDNGYFDEVKERKDLYFFVDNLKRCLNAVYSLAEKQHRRLLQSDSPIQEKVAM